MVHSLSMKNLTVGEAVFLVSNEVYCKTGTVIAVTPSGYDVQTVDELIRLDNEGKETEAGRFERLGFGPRPGDTFHNVLWFSAPEFQPYQIEDATPEEIARHKTRELEQFPKWKAMMEERAARKQKQPLTVSTHRRAWLEVWYGHDEAGGRPESCHGKRTIRLLGHGGQGYAGRRDSANGPAVEHNLGGTTVSVRHQWQRV